MYRRTKTKTEHGETKFEDRTKVYENIAVGLSFKNVGNLNQSSSVATTIKECNLFTRPEVKILPNDIIEVKKLGEITEFIAGDCESHLSHNNISLIKKDSEV